MKKFYNYISSVKFAVILFIVIAASSLAGTFMKQEAAIEIIYGSFWFILLLSALFINTTTCLLKKKLSIQNAGSILMHLGVPVIMAGAVLGGLAGYSGSVMIDEGGSVKSVKARGREIILPFRIKLEKFEISRRPVSVRHYLALHPEDGMDHEEYEFRAENETVNIHGNKIQILRIIPDFVMGPDLKPATRSDDWNNPAVKILAKGKENWLFSLYPDFHGAFNDEGYNFRYRCKTEGGEIVQYTSYVEVSENPEKGERTAIMVNKPYRYMGHTIYQASYDEKTLKASGLIVKKDPGVPLVYAGFMLLCMGMMIIVAQKLLQEE